MRFVSPWLSLAVPLVAAACTCGPPGVRRSYGELGLSASEAPPAREVTVDFGPVEVDTTAARAVVVWNLGAAPISLEAPAADGAAVAFGAGDGRAPFVVSPDPTGVSLQPGERLTLEVRFRPSGAAPEQASVTLPAAGTVDGEGVGRVTLAGTPVRSRCALPGVIDFGVVGVGTTASAAFTVRNDSELASALGLGQPTSVGPDAAAFTLSDESARDGTPLPPLGTATVQLQFEPTEPRAYRAVLPARAHPTCPPGQVTLVGAAVVPTVRWSPAALDFGAVVRGGRALLPVTFTSTSRDPVSVTGFAVAGPYRVLDAQGQPLTTLPVPPGGAATLQVEFAPMRGGVHPSTLAFSLSAKQTRGAISLRGALGGPALRATPAAVAMGQVAYFPSAATPQSTTRRVSLRNVGTPPLTPSPEGNLLLGRPDAAGVRGPPYFEVRPLGTSTRPSEFRVSVAGAPYDPTIGLVARAGADGLELDVTLTPESIGPKAAELIILSNDPARPEVVVPLTGEAVTLPPCLYTLSPATLDFGPVLPGVTLERAFTLTNRSSAPGAACLVTQVELTPATHAAFSLSAPVAPTTLGPGQALTARVQLRPTGAAPATPLPLSGAIEVRLSSDTAPRALVGLRALLGAPCVTITPSASFGAVPFGCGDATVNVDVTNTCGWPVTLLDAAVTGAAGQPAGGPACAGSAACPEFTLTTALPAAGLTLAPAQREALSVRYAPLDPGADLGELTVRVELGGATAVQAVALTGTGAAGGCVDCFPLALTPPAFPSVASGLPYANPGNSLAGWSGVPGPQGSQLWTSSGATLDSVGFHNFLPVVANDFTLEADVRIGQSISDFQLSLWDASYGVGYKVSLGPSDGDTPYFGLYRVVNDPARNVADRPFGDDVAITCHGAGACNTSTTEPAVGDLTSVVTSSGGYPASGGWFHFTFTKVGPAVTTRVNALPPLTWTSRCLDRNWRLVFGSWADVSVRNVSIR
ncbi:MAG: choice-of-anchor D domain-containing protein [Myxococcaceae bacterium]|nr:choice-of-anchor D domain-containing protein [Myxococcaceae bacterium]MCA3016899.1 choice-of-anchor D domain-containing protein [Myxococcaceae bacterium]